jgi:MGT family glycosyltransferase
VRTRAANVEELTALGLHAATIDPAIERIEVEDWRGRTQIDSFLRLIRGYYEWGKLEIPDLREAIEQVAPDAVIVDSNCMGGTYVAEASGLPHALYCPYPPAFRSEDAPPHGLGLRPARGRLGKARDRLLRSTGDRLVAPELRRFNELRANLGPPPLRTLDEQFLNSDLFIAFTAEPYEYHRSDWPPQVRLVGPGLWEPPDDPPPWLQAAARPIVLVTASTAFQTDTKLITSALEALAGENVMIVATTAAHDPAQFRAPSNARVQQFLPHRPILARATCVVCHGGQGITQKALAAGVPVCVVPFSRDQFDVARRVEINDAGVRLHHKRLNPERLRAAVHTAITKRPGAQRVAKAFADTGGAPAAAGAIEELLTTGTQTDQRHGTGNQLSHLLGAHDEQTTTDASGGAARANVRRRRATGGRFDRTIDAQRNRLQPDPGLAPRLAAATANPHPNSSTVPTPSVAHQRSGVATRLQIDTCGPGRHPPHATSRRDPPRLRPAELLLLRHTGRARCAQSSDASIAGESHARSRSACWCLVNARPKQQRGRRRSSGLRRNTCMSGLTTSTRHSDRKVMQ